MWRNIYGTDLRNKILDARQKKTKNLIWNVLTPQSNVLHTTVQTFGVGTIFLKVILCSPSLHSFEYHMIGCDVLLTYLQSAHLLFWLGFIDDRQLRRSGLNVTQWLRRRVVIVSRLLCVFPLLYPACFVITLPIITLCLLLWAHPLQLRVMRGCGEVGWGGCGWMGGV